MRKKIFQSILFVSMIVLVVANFILFASLYQNYYQIQVNQLKQDVNLVGQIYENGNISALAKIDPDLRVTYIQSDGKVLFDNQVDYQVMENHADRPEVKQALEYQSSTVTRKSTTLFTSTIYAAKKLNDGNIIRVALRQDSVILMLLKMVQPFLLMFVICLVICYYLSQKMAKHLVEPLNQIDLNHPLDNQSYDEISPLLTKIASLHQENQEKMAAIGQKANEFTSIEEGMHDGLIVIDHQEKIVSINQVAKYIFHVDDVLSKNITVLNHSYDLSKAIQKCKSDGSARVSYQDQDTMYEMDLSKLVYQGEYQGIVIFIFNVSQQYQSEQIRRQFTANVSHELKTPLQAILGSAELLEHGMVKAEDQKQFIQTIHQQAKHLSQMVEDIIYLSKLDEGFETQRQEFYIDQVILRALNVIEPLAQEKGILIEKKLDPVKYYGVESLVYNVVYNLLENAVKYNRDNGSIRIILSQDEKVKIIIQDSGIGMDEKEIPRIFERFYRIDKSHSKKVSGTGLGLSIVKHALLMLNGEIHCTSQLGEGTTFTIEL